MSRHTCCSHTHTNTRFAQKNMNHAEKTMNHAEKTYEICAENKIRELHINVNRNVTSVVLCDILQAHYTHSHTISAHTMHLAKTHTHKGKQIQTNGIVTNITMYANTHTHAYFVH